MPGQATDAAIDAVASISRGGHIAITIGEFLAEFDSLLRKLVTVRRATLAEANEVRDRAMSIHEVVVPVGSVVRQRAWELAARLGQSDVFDALGYAAAEAYDAEFWTSDGRFANAAQGAALSRLRHVS